MSSTPPPRRPGIALQDRQRQGPPPTPPVRRHCYLRPTAHTPEVEAMVLAWAQEQRGWVALIVHVEPDTERVIQEWVPADQLRPASH